MKAIFFGLAGAMLISMAAHAQNQDQQQSSQACSIPAATVKLVQSKLATVVTLSDGNGGIFKPNRMWSAVVDRNGILCSVIVTGDAWPGSRAIAIAKAETANDFSNSALALSTANLYAPTQPGGSLYGLNNSNPFNPRFNAPDTGIGFVVGGRIKNFGQYSYLEFVLPGVVMLNIISAAFLQSTAQVYFQRFQKSIEEILAARQLGVGDQQVDRGETRGDGLGFVGAAGGGGIVAGIGEKAGQPDGETKVVIEDKDYRHENRIAQ